MKKAFHPSATKITPLKSTTSDIITDWGKQMERWAEHYQELYSKESAATDSTVKSTCTLPILEEVDVPPSVDELSKAIDSHACGKAPGKDSIPPEVIRSGKQTALLHHLHELLHTVLGRGDCAPRYAWCQHHHLIQEQGWPPWLKQLPWNLPPQHCWEGLHLSVLNRLQVLAEHVYPEVWCGFRAGRSTVDMISSLHQLQEKCCKQRWPLYITFIDLTKAFDLVSRKGLFTAEDQMSP